MPLDRARKEATAIRLLMLTVCRLSEVQNLRWEYVDLDAGELRLPDTKTGARGPAGTVGREAVDDPASRPDNPG